MQTAKGLVHFTQFEDHHAQERCLKMQQVLHALQQMDALGCSSAYLLLAACRYWKAKVGVVRDVKRGQFGAATKAINGQIECSGGDSTIPQKRFDIYVATLTAFGIDEAPQEGGCYS